MGITINSSGLDGIAWGGELIDGTDTPIPEASISMTAAESAAVLIEDFAGIEAVRSDTYGRLHTLVSGAGSLENAVQLLDDAEIIFINNNFSEAERLKETTKGGKIKRTKFLPNDYLSAKSVLIGCLEKGIPLFDEDGNPMGKSALPDKRSGKVEKTPQQKLDAALANALKYAREVHGESALSVQVMTTSDPYVTTVQLVKA